MNLKIFFQTLIILFIWLSLFKKNKYFLLLSKYYQLIKSRKYIDKCLETVSFKNNFNKKNINPEISVIIPVFNCENSIKSSVSSIQNQRIEEIEIILVNDFSRDNSKKVIENIQKQDSRIVIINNNKNMGTLYSRNLGAIYANGKYIYCLDNDDMFLNDNIILKIYKIAKKYDYDIIGFNIINVYTSIRIVINMKKFQNFYICN